MHGVDRGRWQAPCDAPAAVRRIVPALGVARTRRAGGVLCA